MQTRPLLSSEPGTVEMNGWTNPVIAPDTPLPRMAFRAAGGARGLAGHTDLWDSVG
jgi:hypothetical protein